MHTTHIVESMIREASLCATQGRPEGLRSGMALMRNSVNTPVRDKMQEERKSSELRTNQYVTKGKRGERIRKEDGQVEKAPLAEGRGARGSVRTKSLLEVMAERQSLASLGETSGERARLIDVYNSSSDECFSKERLDQEISKIKEAQESHGED